MSEDIAEGVSQTEENGEASFELEKRSLASSVLFASSEEAVGSNTCVVRPVSVEIWILAFV